MKPSFVLTTATVRAPLGSSQRRTFGPAGNCVPSSEPELLVSTVSTLPAMLVIRSSSPGEPASSCVSSVSSTQSPGARPSTSSRPRLVTVISSTSVTWAPTKIEPFSRDQTKVALLTLPESWISTR